jgi:hypothetical protein
MSETKWRIDPEDAPRITVGNCIFPLSIISPTGLQILITKVNHGNATKEERDAAAFLVTAANAHDALVSALTHLLHVVDESTTRGNGVAAKAARAALKLAKGSS